MSTRQSRLLRLDIVVNSVVLPSSIDAYGEQALMLPAAGEVTRRAAVDGFVDLFRPGNIVDLALGGSLR